MILSKLMTYFQSKKNQHNQEPNLNEVAKDDFSLDPLLKFEPKINTKSTILYDEKDIFIYLNHVNELGWDLKSIPNHARAALQEFILINSLINTYLGRHHKIKASKLLASRLYYCLFAKEKYDVELVFKEPKEYVNRVKGAIKITLIETPKFAIYINRKDDIDWWYYQDIPEYMLGAFEEFESLRALASTTLPDSYKFVFMKKLASALVNAFNKNNYDIAKDCFKDVRLF